MPRSHSKRSIGTSVGSDDAGLLVELGDDGLIDPSMYAGGGGGVTDHGALTGLGNDDHTIYMLEDGTRAMSGDLDMGGGGDIVNVQNVDGRDVANDGTKLDGIESSATADQTDAEIATAYGNEVGQVSAGEKTAGTETALRTYAPKDIADMADTHGGGGSPTPVSYMKRSSTSTLSVTSTPTIIPWDTLSEDQSGADISYNGSNQFVAEVDGDYRLGGFVTVQSSALRAQIALEIYVNGSATGFQRSGAYIRNSGSSYDFWALELSGEPFPLTAGDTVELRVGQVTGATYGYGGALAIALRGVSSMVWFERIPGGDNVALFGTAWPASPADGQLFFRTDISDPELFTWDSTNSLWLSVERRTYLFSHDTADTSAGIKYLPLPGAARSSATWGYRVNHDLLIHGISFSTTASPTGNLNYVVYLTGTIIGGFGIAQTTSTTDGYSTNFAKNASAGDLLAAASTGDLINSTEVRVFARRRIAP